MAGPVRVLVVDDQRPFRVAASTVLRRTPGFELVGEAGSGEEALQQVAALSPDLVLMDITMPGMGGVEATRTLTAAPGGPVVLLLDLRRHRPPAGGRRGRCRRLHQQGRAGRRPAGPVVGRGR